MQLQNLFLYRRLPGRVDVEQTANLLGFLPHEIPLLVRWGLLKPLGNPPANAHKYFAAATIENHARDPEWLDKATRVLTKHTRTKNQITPSRWKGKPDMKGLAAA